MILVSKTLRRVGQLRGYSVSCLFHWIRFDFVLCSPASDIWLSMSFCFMTFQGLGEVSNV